MFQGASQLNLDAKGRLAVPTKHREALSGIAGATPASAVLSRANTPGAPTSPTSPASPPSPASPASPATGKVVLTAHPDGCLILYPASAWEPIVAKLLQFSSLDPRLTQWRRLLIGFAEDLVLDSAGRILISPELRHFAGLERQAMLVGQGTHFEVWNLAAWTKQLEALRAGGAGGSRDLPPAMENFSL